MRSFGNLINFFEAQRNIFGICPHCRELFRLSDIKISYKAKFGRDWYDKLEEQEEKLQEEQIRIEETLKKIRQRTIERTRKVYLPKMLMQADPVFTPLGYYPQDVKALFDPIDFVIFDGMNRDDKVNRVVFMDEHNTEDEIRRVQHSIETAIKHGKYSFQSVLLAKTGQIQT